MKPTNTNDEQVRKIMGLDRADREAAEQAYTVTAFDYEENPVGSADWCRFWDGWRAALSQPASEPVVVRRVRSEFAAELDGMDNAELRRRILAQASHIDAYAQCLDGLGVAVGVEGFRDPAAIRRAFIETAAPRINEGSGRDAVSGWHPMQGYGPDYQGTLRFNTNAIVEYLLDHGPFDMNALAAKNFSEADRCQFAQLIGYSVSGFYGLSYAANYPHDEPSGVKEFLTTDATPPAAVGGAELDCPHSAFDACNCYAVNAGKS